MMVVSVVSNVVGVGDQCCLWCRWSMLSLVLVANVIVGADCRVSLVWIVNVAVWCWWPIFVHLLFISFLFDSVFEFTIVREQCLLLFSCLFGSLFDYSCVRAGRR